MTKLIVSLSLAVLIAGPGHADGLSSMAVQMGYEPDYYTASELVQIMYADDVGAMEQTIERNRAAFRARIEAVMRGTDTGSTAVISTQGLRQ